ncbi:MAG: MoxJ protein [Chthonomonadaceae bacterium]|nr:MoxJ protein [Chthonomonadaceae bacterium]
MRANKPRKRRVLLFTAVFGLAIVGLGWFVVTAVKRHQNTLRLALEVRKGRRADDRKVRSLLAEGADPNALLNWSSVSLDSLVERMVTSHQHAHGTTIFIRAAGVCDDRVVRSLLDAGADARDGAFGYTALTNAVMCHNHRNVALLVASGADVNSSGQRVSPLLYTLENPSDIEDLTFLIAHGADVNLQSSSVVPIAYAINRDNLEGLKILLRADADVNRPDFAGETPLMCAALYGETDAIPILLDSGADRTLRDKKGRTAEQIAISFGHRQAAQLLHNYRPHSAGRASRASRRSRRSEPKIALP